MLEVKTGEDRTLILAEAKGEVGLREGPKNPIEEWNYLRGRERDLRTKLRISGDFDLDLALDWLAVRRDLLLLEKGPEEARTLLGFTRGLVEDFGRPLIQRMIGDLDDADKKKANANYGYWLIQHDREVNANREGT